MYQVIIVIHVLLGLGIIGLIMMQQGKGADAGAAFGTGSSGSVFGAQGAASFLSRTTAIMAALFFTTSLGLAVLNSKQGTAYDLMNPSSVEQGTSGIPDLEGSKGVEGIPAAVPEELPVTPEVTGAEKPVKVPVSEIEIKNTAVPKAEEIKPVEEKAVPDKTESTIKK